MDTGATHSLIYVEDDPYARLSAMKEKLPGKPEQDVFGFQDKMLADGSETEIRTINFAVRIGDVTLEATSASVLPFPEVEEKATPEETAKARLKAK